MHPSKIQSLPSAAPRPRLWWCNADFDLMLAHGGGKMPARILEAAGAMTWPLWPALSPDDFLIVPEPPPEGWLASLEAKGLRVPRFVTEAEVARAEASAARRAPPDACGGTLPPSGGQHGGDPARARFTPFGWSSVAASRNAARLHPVPHPSPDVVRRVNSRAFSLELERELCGDGACRAVFLAPKDAGRAWLETAPPGRYVAKGNHGLAGIGQLRFTIPARDGADAEERSARARVAEALRKIAARHGGLVVEEELEVVQEWGVLFRLGRDGRRSPLRRHGLLSGPSGGYAGALVLPGHAARAETLWNTHGGEAVGVVDGVARALHQAGYFGPVGVDMFVHRRGDRQYLRPLVDLNARQSMAWPAHGLATRFPDKAVLFRQYPSKLFKNLHDGHALFSASGFGSFDDKSRRGAILLTPLLPFTRVACAFIGDDETDVSAQHERLLATLSAFALESGKDA